MFQNSKLGHQLLAYILLLSLFLQSCGNFSNSTIPKAKEPIDKIHRSATKNEYLLDQELIAEGGHLVTFHEEQGKLQADVTMNAPQGFSKTYTNLPVQVAQDIDLQQLPHLSTEEQKRIIHFNLSGNKQSPRISLFKEGLRGGMMEGDDYQEKEKEKEREPGSDLSNYHCLLKFAIQGDSEAQFQLGKRAYKTWQGQRTQEAYHEAAEWLGKAKTQEHQGAIALLEEMNSLRLPKSILKFKKEEKGKEKEKEKEKEKDDVPLGEQLNRLFVEINVLIESHLSHKKEDQSEIEQRLNNSCYAVLGYNGWLVLM